jgi:lauroyl/myristoyl acyltransferase
MPLEARKIINSPLGLSIAFLVGRYMPYSLGHRIADFAADFISKRKDWHMVRAVRANQWVVHDGKLDKSALDQAVQENFRDIAHSIFDLYHNIYNRKAFLGIIDPHPIAVQLVQRPKYAERGLVLAGVHMSNFDLIFQVSGLEGIKAMALTLTEMDAGYRKQFEMRQKIGLNLVPASIGSIKHAVEHLRAGGMVMTGLDRPDEGYSYRPLFFGRPAAVPVHHIFLAVKAKVPVLVAAPILRPDGKYYFLFSDPIEMQPHPDRQTEILINTEAVLRVAEGFIRQDPKQWAMTFPVWPDVMDQVPV